ncbi:hypothetical protein ACWEQ7_04345 [Streptomyces sp. NPDC004069]
MTESEFLALLDQASAEATVRETAYREWLGRKDPELAEELTETLLPTGMRAAGLRFEWTEAK